MTIKENTNNLQTFIKDPSQYIFHFFGNQNTQKSQTIRDALRNHFGNEEYNKKVNWIVTGYDQTNMVIEHLDGILKGFAEQEKWQDLLSPSHAKNIHIFMEKFRKHILDTSGETNPKRPYVLVIDNAENIFSLHFSLKRKNWRKELVEQWRIFLKNLIELNVTGFYLKVILITNEHILDLEDLANFLKYDVKRDPQTPRPHKNKKFHPHIPNLRHLMDSLKHPLKQDPQADNPYKNRSSHDMIEELKSFVSQKRGVKEEECDGKIVKPALEMIGRILNDKEVDRAGTVRREFYYGILIQKTEIQSRNYINVGDIIHQYRYGMMLAEVIIKLEDELSIQAVDGYVTNYIRKQSLEVAALTKSINAAIEDKDIYEIHRNNIKIIKRVYSVYHLIDLFQKIKRLDLKNGEERKPEPFFYKALRSLLTLPVRKEFSDVGDILRTYGYSNLLMEMIEAIEKNEEGITPGDEDLARYLQNFDDVFKNKFNDLCITLGRMNILKGNISYYNYPEDYAFAFTQYCKVLESYQDESDQPESIRKCCFLATYEIINVLFQLVERKWESILSLEQEEAIKRLIDRLAVVLRCKTESPLMECWKEYDLLDIAGAMITWLIDQWKNMQPPCIESEDHRPDVGIEPPSRDTKKPANEIEKILKELKQKEKRGDGESEEEEAFFERTMVAKIKYHKLKIKLLIDKEAKAKNLHKFAFQLTPEEIEKLLENLEKLKQNTNCGLESFWKTSIFYHLSKWLYFLANAVTSIDAAEGNGSNDNGLNDNELWFDRLSKINQQNLPDRYSLGESLWRKAKQNELAGDIMRLYVKQARTQKKRKDFLKERIEYYNKAKEIYLTLNCGHQTEQILDKIELAESLLSELSDPLLTRNEYDEYEKIKQ